MNASTRHQTGSFIQTIATILIVIIVLLMLGMCSVSKQEKQVEYSRLFQWGAALKTVTTNIYYERYRYPTPEDLEWAGIASELPPESEMIIKWLPDGVIQLSLPDHEGFVEYRPRKSGDHLDWECRASAVIIEAIRNRSCRTIDD